MKKTIVEILIDASGSMGRMKNPDDPTKDYLIEGRTRMSIIKDILIKDLIPLLDFCDEIFVRTFRTDYFPNELNEVEGVDVIEEVFAGEFDDKLIKIAVKGIKVPRSGGTPISAALKVAETNLNSYKKDNRVVILLTDGEENGGGDYIKVARYLGGYYNVPIKLFIIGLNQNNHEESRSRKAATGGYVNITMSKYDLERIKLKLSAVKSEILKQSLRSITPTVPLKSAQAVSFQQTKVNLIKSKIVNLPSEKFKKTNIEKLEERILEQVNNTQLLLQELRNLKDAVLFESLVSSGINSTTITIDEEISEEIRSKSEAYLYKRLCKEYGKSRIVWMNQDKESYQPYDFKLLDDTGNMMAYIECKGTPAKKPTFYMTKNEWHFFLNNQRVYSLYRVFNLSKHTSCIKVENLMQSILSGQVVPYLFQPEILKEHRVYLSLV